MFFGGKRAGFRLDGESKVVEKEKFANEYQSLPEFRRIICVWHQWSSHI